MEKHRRIPFSAKEHDGCKFWPLDEEVQIECTYDKEFNIRTYYLNRIEITQDDLITELADLYDTKQTEQDIRDYEHTEASHQRFLKEHERRAA